MRVRNLVTALSATIFALQASFSFASRAIEEVEWENWPVVGEAQLSVLFFDVYQSSLQTPTGMYQQSVDITPHPLALSIHYQRDISRKQLVEATGEQWEKLGYPKSTRREWLRHLEQIFPNVEKGQKIAYVTDGQIGRFYYQTSRDLVPIGAISDERLNDAFLSIWLSPNTQYPKLRQQLIGDEQ